MCVSLLRNVIEPVPQQIPRIIETTQPALTSAESPAAWRIVALPANNVNMLARIRVAIHCFDLMFLLCRIALLIGKSVYPKQFMYRLCVFAAFPHLMPYMAFQMILKEKLVKTLK